MIRELKIYVNPSEGAIVRQEGDSFFYLGDNNKIQVIPSEDIAFVSISGNIPGSGSYIAELVKQEDGSFVLGGEDMNGFLQRVGKVICNIHIADEEGKRKTTLAFQFESRMAYDREATIVAPTAALTLEEFYATLEVIKNLNVEEISEAVEVVESLDIEKIEQALEITNTLDSKIEEVDATLATAKETEAALNDTVSDINQKLEAGEFKGEKGDKGDPGVAGPAGEAGPAGADGKDGNDYILTDDDKNEIANVVYSMFTSAEEVAF